VVEAVEAPAATQDEVDEPTPAPSPEVPAQPEAPAPGTGTSSGLTLVDVRRLWPDLLEAVKLKRRFTWILLSQNAQVAAVDDKTMTIALVNAGARNSFSSGGSEEILRQAAIDVIGHDWRIEAIVDPSAQPGSEPVVTRPAVPEPAAPAAPAAAPEAGPPPPDWAAPDQPPAAAETRVETNVDPAAVASARGAIQETRPQGQTRESRNSTADEDAHRDDPAADDHGLGGAALLERELGASIIEEIKHD
jgi:DNA polymerase-3 subunit gamma/tau